MTPEERLALATGGNTVFWFGPAGVAANNGIPPAISAGTTFVDGENLWHLSNTFFSPEVLMDAVPLDAVIHTLHPVERGMYEDLGWRLSPLLQPVPEPDALLLLLTALVVSVYCRRQGARFRAVRLRG